MCVCEHTCVSAEARGQLEGISCLLPAGPLGLNSGCQSWQQVFSPAKALVPFSSPQNFFLGMIFPEKLLWAYHWRRALGEIKPWSEDLRTGFLAASTVCSVMFLGKTGRAFAGELPDSIRIPVHQSVNGDQN